MLDADIHRLLVEHDGHAGEAFAQLRLVQPPTTEPPCPKPPPEPPLRTGNRSQDARLGLGKRAVPVYALRFTVILISKV